MDQTTKRCTIYATRFGRHKTVEGTEFLCAPMRVYLMHKPAPPHCGYGRIVRIDGQEVYAVKEGVPIVPGMA